MKKLCIIGHLGLGDHLITNAIVRHYASQYDFVAVICKQRNLKTVEWMFSDAQNVELVPVSNEEMAEKEAIQIAASFSGDVLRLGCYNPDYRRGAAWDEQFYRHAGIPFNLRWDGFKFDRSISEIEPPKMPYAFVHDDKTRGYLIDRNRIHQNALISPFKTDTIFQWIKVIEEAEEIHCIDSSFAILIDSLPGLKAKSFKLHKYARPNGLEPTYRNKLEIVI